MMPADGRHEVSMRINVVASVGWGSLYIIASNSNRQLFHMHAEPQHRGESMHGSSPYHACLRIVRSV